MESLPGLDPERWNNCKELLDHWADRYNRRAFIANDPISIPHRYSLRQDIEISGLWTALLSWGQRKTILSKAALLFQLMDDRPYEFICHHSEVERTRFSRFVHRTFQYEDTIYFLWWLQQYYREHNSLESLFSPHRSTYDNLVHFHNQFFCQTTGPQRTRKHVPNPLKGSTCKRMNMFLRWMVRHDSRGVDFGLWTTLSPAQLVIPLDVHVEKVARHLGLLRRKSVDWLAACELTDALRQFDPDDPIRYDFALFMMGIENRLSDLPN